MTAISSDTTLRKDGEIVTYSGLVIKPLDPDPELIVIDDIAHATSNCCRFTGHVREFYSVAQHSVLVSKIVPKEDALWGLLHDASEAYLSDLARPIKLQPGLGDIYRRAETILMEAVCERFGLPAEMPESVKWADDVLLRTEQRDLMPDLRRHEGKDYYPETITGWAPWDAELNFLKRFETLTVPT